MFTQVGSPLWFFSQTHSTPPEPPAFEYKLPKLRVVVHPPFGLAFPTDYVAAFGLVVKRE